jgi:hypothetical protein
MVNYRITEGTSGEFVAEFADSGAAHRFARSYSYTTVNVVRVRCIETIRPALTTGDEGVYYSDGGRL